MNGDIAHKQPLLRRQSAIYAQAQAGKLLVLVENARVPIASGARKAIFARYGNTAYDGSGKSEMFCVLPQNGRCKKHKQQR